LEFEFEFELELEFELEVGSRLPEDGFLGLDFERDLDLEWDSFFEMGVELELEFVLFLFKLVDGRFLDKESDLALLEIKVDLGLDLDLDLSV